MVPAAQAHRFTLLAHGPLAVPESGLHVRAVIRPGAGGTRWEQATLAAAVRQARPDVLFAPGYTAPLLCPVPLALAVHDVSFAAHPEWFPWREGLRRRLVTRLAAQRARVVLTLSAFSRDEIVRHLAVDPTRVRVIPLGLGMTPDWHAAGPPAPPRAPLVLFVGSLFNRRHVDALVRAMPSVLERVTGRTPRDRRRQPHLAAVRSSGSGRRARHRLARHRGIIRGRLPSANAVRGSVGIRVPVRVRGVRPDAARGARGRCSAGRARHAVAREVYGAAATYVAAPDPGLVADAVVAILTDQRSAASGARRRASRARAGTDWNDAARATLGAIEDAGR